jgi:hypothetical protein
MTDHETEQLPYRQLSELLLIHDPAMEPRFRDLDARLTRFEAKIYAIARHHENKQLTGFQYKSGSWCRRISYGVIRDIQIDGKEVYRGLMWQLTDRLGSQKERHQ